jgi:hypothetical protein
METLHSIHQKIVLILSKIRHHYMQALNAMPENIKFFLYRNHHWQDNGCDVAMKYICETAKVIDPCANSTIGLHYIV